MTLARYALAAEGEERQRLMTATHAHFAARSAAEFLADWKPDGEDNPNPLAGAIDKTLNNANRKSKNDAPAPTTEKSPSP